MRMNGDNEFKFANWTLAAGKCHLNFFYNTLKSAPAGFQRRFSLWRRLKCLRRRYNQHIWRLSVKRKILIKS